MRFGAVICRNLVAWTAIPVIWLAAPVAATEPAPVFMVGAQRIDITPADLSGLNPMNGKAFAKVHDPIYARIVVMALGKQAAAFVSIDAMEVGNMDEPRRRIARETGIPADHVKIGRASCRERVCQYV